MAVLYGRIARVHVAGLTIEAPRIDFDLKRESTRTPVTGNIAIHNLTRQHERQIVERGERVRLEAGYEMQVGELFRGSVQGVERRRERLARITRILLDSPSIDAEHRSGVTIRSYAGTIPVTQIVGDICREDLMLMLGDTSAIGSAAVVDWSHEGTASDAISELLDPLNVTWYDDDGTIRFSREDRTQPDAETIEMNKDTGLIGAPTVTSDGAMAISLLNHRLRLGNMVNLRSVAVDGMWEIVGVRHYGSSWRGDAFYSEVDLRDPNAAETPP